MSGTIARWGLWFSILGLAACGAATPATPGADAGGGADAADTGTAPPPGDSGATDTGTPPADAVTVPTRAHSLNLDLALPPGREDTQCVEMRLGNATGGLIRRIHVSLRQGSHHLIVYRSNATQEQRTPSHCQGLGGILSGAAPLFIAQMPESDLVMPDGVGMTIAANQMIRIEEHFINPGMTPVQGGATVTVDVADAETTNLTRADMMFWGTVRISLPPRTTSSVQYYQRPRAGVRVFGLTSHTHQLGTLATISVAANATDPMAREVHRSTHWEEPPLTLFNPAMEFDGAQGLHLRCNYNNTTTRTIRFGEDFDDEMCFMWAYYYPSHGFDVRSDGLGF